MLVNAAAPNAQHVHIAVAHGFKQLAIFVSGDTRRETVGRNPVPTLAENGNAIDHKSEALARLVRLLPEFERAQAGARRCLVRQLAIRSAREL